MDEIIAKETGLTGAQIIDRLRKGHMVRRACWVDDFFIRICNELGFDDDGNAITDGGAHQTHIYTIATNGYFMHIGSSAQPFRKARAFGHKDHWDIATRDGEGVAMLFADDWEDYGFISDVDFDTLRKNTKEQVRENIKQSHDKAIEKVKNA